MPQLTFFSEGTNIAAVAFIILIIMGCIFVLISKTYKVMKKIGIITLLGFYSFIFGTTIYMQNYVYASSLLADGYTLSDIAININMFKKHENRVPKERDFYLSGFLNNSLYFKTKNNEKIFTPIEHEGFKIIDNDKSVSFSYTNNYDKTSFIETGQAYRYCLYLPEILQTTDSLKDVNISVNGKEIDYKTAKEESMKDICYSDKPNSYTLTFF